jgi:hypothetical protein
VELFCVLLSEEGVKECVVPDGTPDADRLMVRLCPPLRVMEIVVDPLVSRFSVTIPGLADITKSGPICTFSVNVVLRVGIEVTPT